MFDNYNEMIRGRIESDLTSFADPGGVRLNVSGRRFVAEWTMRGKPREATFTVSQERGVTVKVDNTTQPYAVFLAGTGMADLRHMARMIERTGNQDIFVPTRAQRTDTDTGDRRPATDLLSDLLENHEMDLTQVVMVTGEAGAGKTRILQELVLRQADRYLHGQTDKLLLYVNAQGRALARLNEALATELQDLRVHLTYHSVATLTRIGLLVPVIDGFDELLGVSGYDDAFSSLATFLEQLEGDGRMVASARSVYYEDEFLSRASRVSTKGGQAWSHIPIKVLPWSDDDRRVFLQELTERESLPEEERIQLRARVREVFRGNEQLESKPLFFVRTMDLLLRDPDFSGGEDLLGTLTHRFLEREQREKLLDRQQRPLLSEEHLERLMSELAEEMWNQETRELDPASVREVAEYILDEQDIPETTRQIVVQRMPTLAFLSSSERHVGVVFEHEVFFFHFLARAIVSQHVQDRDMRIILSRSSLPEFVAERIAFELGAQQRLNTLDALQEILDRLAEAGKTEWRRAMQVRENAGLIVLALLREFAKGRGEGYEVEDRTVSSVTFPGSHLDDMTFRKCALVNVWIHRTNLATTRFMECEAREVHLEEVKVKVGSTRLELNGLRVPEEVSGVQVWGDQGSETIYGPNEIARVLDECGAAVEVTEEGETREVPCELRTLLGRLMRTYERTNPVCMGDERLKGLLDDRQWTVLRRHLIEHGIVKPEVRAASGRRKEFLRRQFLPADIMAGESRAGNVKPQIARFWDSLEAEGA